jgi:hypothetical protein
VTSPEHVGARALFIAALESRDPERLAAVAHARTCADCARALRDGQRLLNGVDAALPPPEPSAGVLARTAARVHAAARMERWIGSAKAAGAAMLAVFVLAGVARHHAPDPDFALFAGALLVTGFVAAASIHRPWLSFAAVIALGAGAAWRGEADAPLSIAVGIKCASFELAGAAATVLALLAPWRQPRVALAPIELAALAGAGSLAGVTALIVSCPASHGLEHVVLFHLGGVVLAMLLGFVAQVVFVRRSSRVANI